MAPRAVALLRIATSMGIAVSLSACLTGGSSTSVSPLYGSAAPSGSTTVPASTTRTFDAAADGDVVAQLRIGETADRVSPARIETFGQAFPAGLVRSHLVVRDNGRVLPTQLDVKRRHPDGSVRHAIVSAQMAALAAGETRSFQLVASNGQQPSGAVDPQAAISAGFDVAVEIVEGGQRYTASARELLLGTDPERWLAGPLATEVRLAGVPKAGATPHPALGVLFDVRFQADGTARVSVVVENTFHDSPGNRTYDVRITPAGASSPAFERAGLTHLYYSRWREVVGWRVAPSTNAIAIDWRRLADAGAIPNYDPGVAIDPSAVTELVTRANAASREPMSTGIVVGAMPMAGGRWDIGPLPTWTAIALLAADPRAYRAMLDTGERAGSFSTHLRDRADREIYSIDRHPTTALNPRNPAVGRDADPGDLLPECANCTTPYLADRAHQPSLAFVPYLSTGDAYYWDELKFWANYNFLEANARPYLTDPNRGFSQGLLQSDEPRGQAWSLRTLGQTVWIAPETDRQRAYFSEKLANNLRWYGTNAAGSNPFGWWSGFQCDSNGRPQPDFSAETIWCNQPWQNDFVLIAFDGLTRMGFTEARVTRDWLALWTIGRFTRPTEYDPNEGAAYALAVRGANGRMYSSWQEIYQNSTVNRATPPATRLSSPECPYCYAAIARGALAGPVRDQLPLAGNARAFIEAQLASFRSTLSRDPTWAIVP